MIFNLDNIILIGSILFLLGIVSTKISKYGIPIVLLFIVLGMVAGSDGIGGIYFNDPKITKFIGIVALSLILFSGGLDTKLTKPHHFIWQGISLATIGVVVTAGIIGLIAHYLFGYKWTVGFLLGSIVSSTDAAAIFPILKAKNLGLKGKLRNVLEFESGSNDPMAYFLTMLFVLIITFKVNTPGDIIWMFLRQMLFGAAIGLVMGTLSQKIINWIQLDFEGLYSVLLLSLVFFTFSFAEFIGGNSFLAVYLLGISLGNKEFIHKKSLTKHFDGQAWFMQIIMFITLGLLVFPSQLVPLLKTGLVLSVCLIFLARPIAVFISLIPFKVNTRSKLFLSWAGLRGSVPIILAIYTGSYKLEVSNLIFNLVFFISITSVIIQGTTFPLVARWLKVSVPSDLKRMSELDKELNSSVRHIKSEILIPQGSSCTGKRIVDLQIPKSALITWIKRDNNYLIHDGNFRLNANDVIQFIAFRNEDIEDVIKLLDAVKPDSQKI